MGIEELEARIKKLEDIEAIRRLKGKYGYFADTKNAAEFMKLVAIANFIAIPCAKDAGDPQFAGNYGRVTGAPPFIRHNSRRDFHYGFPVRVRHRGNKHLFRLKFFHLQR